MAIVAVAALGNSGSSSLALPCCRSCSSSTALRGPFQPLGNTQVQDELRRVHRQAASLPRRVEAVSELFLGTPYKLDALGEGPDGEFDRDPLIRFDAFDCTTFVETVMALSLESDLESAARTLQKIRYKDGQIGYATRNHITELDWVPNNVRAGYLRDITSEVAGRDAIEMSKTVSKRDWLRKSMVSFEGQFSEARAAAGNGAHPFGHDRQPRPRRSARRGVDRLAPSPSHQKERRLVRAARGLRQNRRRRSDFRDLRAPLIGLNLNLLREPKSAEAPR
jgi:hypothetical protein